MKKFMQMVGEIVATILLVLFLILQFSLYKSGYSTFDFSYKNTVKIQRPSLKAAEELLNEVVKGLPEADKKSVTAGPKSVYADKRYNNFSEYDKTILMKNINNDSRWSWLTKNKSGDIYCHDGFQLTIDEKIGDNSSKYTQAFVDISVGWRISNACQEQMYRVH